MRAGRPLRWAVLACVAATAALAIEVGAPWVASGRRDRSGLSLARAVDRLELVDGRGERLVLEAWFLLPLLVALAWLGAALGRARWAGLLAALAGAFVAAAAVVVARGPLPTRWGIPAAAGAGTLAACAGLLGSRPRRPEEPGC